LRVCIPYEVGDKIVLEGYYIVSSISANIHVLNGIISPLSASPHVIVALEILEILTYPSSPFKLLMG